MLKVTSLSIIVPTDPQCTPFNEEKEKEGIFPSTFPHIQNRMVIKTKTHVVYDQDLASSHLGLSCDTSCGIPSIIISSSFACSECIALCTLCIDISHMHAHRSSFVANDDHND